MTDDTNDRTWDTDLEAYRVARETRNFEINLFWQRSNYFLVLNTAIAVGFFTRDALDLYAVALSVIGSVVAVLWVRINLGSKYWQARWEARLELLEDRLGGSMNLFSADRAVLDSDARAGLDADQAKGRVTRKFNELVLKKPSVSKTMSTLSVFFVIVWATALITSVVGVIVC